MIRPRPAQINRVALAVEPDEALNPADVGVLGPDAQANVVSDVGRKLTGIGGVSSQCFGSPFRPHFFSRGR